MLKAQHRAELQEQELTVARHGVRGFQQSSSLERILTTWKLELRRARSDQLTSIVPIVVVSLQPIVGDCSRLFVADCWRLFRLLLSHFCRLLAIVAIVGRLLLSHFSRLLAIVPIVGDCSVCLFVCEFVCICLVGWWVGWAN